MPGCDSNVQGNGWLHPERAHHQHWCLPLVLVLSLKQRPPSCRCVTPTSAAPCVRVCSADFLRGVCAAHWAALQGSVQALGGLSRCSDLLPMVVGDLHAMCDAYGKLLIDALLASMFGEAIVRLAPTLHEVSLPGRLHAHTRVCKAAVLRWARVVLPI